MRGMFSVLAVILAIAACSPDTSTGENECPPDAACAPTVSVPDVVGLDLVKAIDALHDAGFSVDTSGLNKVARGYATGNQTHPRVRVVEMDPAPDTEVEEGTTIFILKAECPRGNLC